MIQITDMNSGRLVFSYTRAQALADGWLVDLTNDAKRYGFTVPFACTNTVWKEVEWRDGLGPGSGQSTAGRLHDVLSLAFLGARKAFANNPVSIKFTVLLVPKHGDAEATKEHVLLLHIGPGDRGEPVLTLMYPDEE